MVIQILDAASLEMFFLHPLLTNPVLRHKAAVAEVRSHQECVLQHLPCVVLEESQEATS